MICILKRDPNDRNEVMGWIIAQDLHDARRQAHQAMETQLAAILYRREFEPPAGQYELPINGPRYTMLVS